MFHSLQYLGRPLSRAMPGSVCFNFRFDLCKQPGCAMQGRNNEQLFMEAVFEPLINKTPDYYYWRIVIRKTQPESPGYSKLGLFTVKCDLVSSTEWVSNCMLVDACEITVIVADHSREKGIQGLVTPVSKRYLSQMSIYLTGTLSMLLYPPHSLAQDLLHLQSARRRESWSGSGGRERKPLFCQDRLQISVAFCLES